jgi:hypothetical protein
LTIVAPVAAHHATTIDPAALPVSV